MPKKLIPAKKPLTDKIPPLPSKYGIFPETNDFICKGDFVVPQRFGSQWRPANGLLGAQVKNVTGEFVVFRPKSVIDKDRRKRLRIKPPRGYKIVCSGPIEKGDFVSYRWGGGNHWERARNAVGQNIYPDGAYNVCRPTPKTKAKLEKQEREAEEVKKKACKIDESLRLEDVVTTISRNYYRNYSDWILSTASNCEW